MSFIPHPHLFLPIPLRPPTPVSLYPLFPRSAPHLLLLCTVPPAASLSPSRSDLGTALSAQTAPFTFQSEPPFAGKPLPPVPLLPGKQKGKEKKEDRRGEAKAKRGGKEEEEEGRDEQELLSSFLYGQ